MLGCLCRGAADRCPYTDRRVGACAPLKTENKKKGWHTLIQISVGCALESAEVRSCDENEEGLRECRKCETGGRSVEREVTPPPNKSTKNNHLRGF